MPTIRNAFKAIAAFLFVFAAALTFPDEPTAGLPQRLASVVLVAASYVTFGRMTVAMIRAACAAGDALTCDDAPEASAPETA